MNQSTKKKSLIYSSIAGVITIAAAIGATGYFLTKDNGKATIVTTSTNPAATQQITSSTPASSSSSTSMASYKDGSYSSTQEYNVEHEDTTVKYTIQISSGKISSVDVSLVSGDRKSAGFVDDFAGSAQSNLAGKSLSSVSSLFVSGSSYTSDAFTDAIKDIKSQAKA
jgi:uncharacterized protein with FMN-binding domain